MTLLGKVFTLLIVVLSLTFLVISVLVNANHINHKQQADKFKKDADTANREKSTLQERLETLKRELAVEQAARRTALASLQSQHDQISNALNAKETELRNLQSAHTQIVGAEKATSETLKARSSENTLLREQLVAARSDRDQLFQRLVNSKDQFNRLQGEHERLTERYADLNNNYNLAASQMQSLGIKPDTELGPPKVNGQVTAVASDGTIELNLGVDDGIRDGHVLDIHRGGNYLGRVKVTKVTPNRSLAQILASYQKGYIQAGDRVDSKLY
jgi:archaellum component FlaC